ncbi:hypothetical protein TWF696_008027 [Orbilia brochopaga]|uniref:Uncharacterized protein n=1 Tax=Orbilia brochopaga TaxID=3140254 RepID=A0AAV9UT31_9PEZI
MTPSGVSAAAYFAFMAIVAADLNPFYMLVNVPQYSSLPPYNLLVENPYVVVSRLGKVDPTTGTPSKYFFLKHLQNTDDAAFDDSIFLHDTETGTVYSETTLPVAAPSSPSSPSIDNNDNPASPDSMLEHIEYGAGGAEAAMGQSGVSSPDFGADLGQPQVNPQVILDLDQAEALVEEAIPTALSQFWEVFVDLDVPNGGAAAGAMRAANLEGASSVAVGSVQAAYGGNQKIIWRSVKGLSLGSGELEGQLWLWRCLLPLGDNFLTRFPEMDAAATTAYFDGLQYLLLVRPKYEDPVAQTPANHDSWDFDGQSCYRIQPWRNVISIRVGDLNNKASLQILDDGDLFPPSNGASANEGSLSLAGSIQSPEEWMQQMDVPQKSEQSNSVSGSIGSPQ